MCIGDHVPMVKIDGSTTLAEAVDAYPDLARVFERRGLDYCCGGGRTLARGMCADRRGPGRDRSRNSRERRRRRRRSGSGRR